MLERSPFTYPNSVNWMKFGAISIPAAASALTCFVTVIITGNSFDDPAYYAFINQMFMTIMPIVIGLGTIAFVTGILGKLKDEQPRMARAGFAMGLVAITLGGLMLYFYII